jgi:hypothetical protein
MKFGKQLFSKLPKLNLWLHAFCALTGVVLLFDVRVFPFVSNFANCFIFLLDLGLISIFGIGDGYPSSGSKIFGGIILAVLTLGTLATLILDISLVIRLLVDRTRTPLFRIYFLIGVVIVLTLSCFMACNPVRHLSFASPDGRENTDTDLALKLKSSEAGNGQPRFGSPIPSL